jgi:uncharacterized protein RhaS with RHS repeats
LADAADYSTFYRRYDPALGRFLGVDPLADSYAEMSPYQFGGNDPVNYNDPTGAVISMDEMGHLSLSSGMGNRGNDFFDRPNMDSSGGGGGFSGGGPNGIGMDMGISGLVPMGSLDTAFDFQTLLYKAGKGEKAAKSLVARLFGDSRKTKRNTLNSGSEDQSDNDNQFEAVLGYIENNRNPTMQILYKDPNISYEGYQWIQTVSSYPMIPGAISNPHVDGSRTEDGTLIGYPFYQKKGWETIQNTRHAIRLGGIAYFQDTPQNQYYFMAETTLVGISGNGNLTPLGSYTWGTMGILPIAPVFSPTPSIFQQEIINQYNKR